MDGEFNFAQAVSNFNISLPYKKEDFLSSQVVKWFRWNVTHVFKNYEINLDHIRKIIFDGILNEAEKIDKNEGKHKSFNIYKCI